MLSISHDSDAHDARLLAEGRIDMLLAKYEDAIVGRCIAALRGAPEAEDVAQDVKVRLLAEFRRGKRYGDLPYRVVVHQIITWTVRDYFESRPTDVPLPERWEPDAADEGEAVVGGLYLESLFDALPPAAADVARLFYLEGLTHEQIAERLGMTRNAVDQALHRAHGRLRDCLAHA